ncbi:uncharacterized protein BO80DRAFT_450644 [Aspergillus ibericus CBS 121593]|uniref:Uncharacterized protein n=1 Tax=Aspergillus ibericus CBS 121593 TaxID=1448316 RepID=A0A395GLT2_9EURO|nr:hypothetical protein BO80DRAFT_450644 [Aspergillus ibericus CBS 121593]RAK94983.1 hypothetical protein BO80DRAFT_450644 [Aspergillus ibericus CBS 121593]
MSDGCVGDLAITHSDDNVRSFARSSHGREARRDPDILHAPVQAQRVDQILTGIDYPYVPLAQSEAALPAIQAHGDFSDTEMARINNRSALSLFPWVAEVLGY